VNKLSFAESSEVGCTGYIKKGCNKHLETSDQEHKVLATHDKSGHFYLLFDLFSGFVIIHSYFGVMLSTFHVNILSRGVV